VPPYLLFTISSAATVHFVKNLDGHRAMMTSLLCGQYQIILLGDRLVP